MVPEELPAVPAAIECDPVATPDLDDFFLEEEVPAKDGKIGKVKTLSTVNIAHKAILFFQPVMYANALFVYNTDNGLYGIDTGETGCWVQKQLNRMYREHAKYGLKVGMKCDPVVREVVSQVKAAKICSIAASPFDTFNGFPVNNCVLTFDKDGKIDAVPYTPSMMFTRKSPVNYNPAASTEKAERILKSWIPDVDDDGKELWEYLLQIPAQAIYQSLPGMTPFKKAYMLIGEHDSGRSSYNVAIQGFFGKDNVTTKSLQSFANRFSGGDLEGKYVNFGDDLSTLKIDEGNQFKTLIGLSEMTVERKFRDTYKARVYATHVYSANSPPEISSAFFDDEAWWSRWDIVLFNNHFRRDPSWLAKNIDAEFYEGFMLLVLQEVQKIIRNEGVLTFSQDWRRVKKIWTSDLSIFHDFVMLSIDPRQGCHISKECMMEGMVDWALHYLPTPSWMTDRDEIAQYRKEKRAALPDSFIDLTKALRVEGIEPRQIGDKSWPYWNVTWRDVAWAKIPELPNDS